MAGSETAEQLRRVPLFSSLDRKELEMIAGLVKEQRYPAGAVILKEGDAGYGLYVIREGTVTVNKDGRELARFGPGEFFGETAMLDAGTRTADVRAETDAVCLTLVSWHIRPLLMEHAGITYKMLQEVVRRLRSVTPAHQ